MRKFAALIATFVAFTALKAAPVGNTSAPGIIREGLFISCNNWIDFRIGYEGDFVADGRMEQYDQGKGRVDTYEQWTNSGTFTLNILNRLDMYAVFGSSRTKADWRFEDLITETVHRIELETKYSFLWASGARAILCEWGHASLGLGGRYSACHYQPAWLTSDGGSVDVAGSHFFWEEWQINLDLAYKIDLFTPYVGVKYSNARTHLTDFEISISESLTGANSFKNRLPVGLYVGCTLSTGKYFMLNLESRVIDEEAISVSGDFRF